MSQGGEQSDKGAAHTELLSEMLAKFGWVQRGPRDKNIACLKCGATPSGKQKAHGVDILFTFPCPYNKRSRGVCLDGKRYAMDSSPTATLKKWLTSVKTTTEHLQYSLAAFETERQVPTGTMIDTGIVAWDCHEGWNPDTATERVAGIKFSPSSTQDLSILLWTKPILDRLATLAAFRAPLLSLEFAYTPESRLTWAKVLTPELLMSDILTIRYREKSEEREEHGVLFLGKGDARDAAFIVPYVPYMQLSSHTSVSVFLPCSRNEISAYQASLNAALGDHPGGRTVALTCKQIQTSEYRS